MLYASAATRGKNTKLDRGAVCYWRFAIISRGHAVQRLLLPCDDISRLQDVEMTISKGLFSRSRLIDFLIQGFLGDFDIKKGEVPSGRLAKLLGESRSGQFHAPSLSFPV